MPCANPPPPSPLHDALCPVPVARCDDRVSESGVDFDLAWAAGYAWGPPWDISITSFNSFFSLLGSQVVHFFPLSFPSLPLLSFFPSLLNLVPLHYTLFLSFSYQTDPGNRTSYTKELHYKTGCGSINSSFIIIIIITHHHRLQQLRISSLTLSLTKSFFQTSLPPPTTCSSTASVQDRVWLHINRFKQPHTHNRAQRAIK
ncbi:uncharacterized protein EI90DRAFT_3037676 [Cantharellus anzutake]|uniref:uncharacterized protein n=1 Tax=Cantharellus anzutake TaxID=1750568 RepID=UPI00190704FA|nr:uncharacterized protein EI90DRAFT_3037676 [Cantharellus anzutake]KAF8339758.1 hypothetical protein EI90DRAFT_3037676 [Cantharellus anzutake]